MARLGRIARVSGNLYRDLDTGQFLPFDEVAPILEQAKAYGYLGALKSSSILGNAIATIIDVYGLSEGEASDAFSRYLAAEASWREGGRDGEKPNYLDYIQ